MKKACTLFLTIVAIWTTFICFDSVRLLNAARELKPIVVISSKTKETQKEKKIIYYGPGYSVTYGYAKEDGSFIAEDENANLGEFRLFGLILIWAWIA